MALAGASFLEESSRNMLGSVKSSNSWQLQPWKNWTVVQSSSVVVFFQLCELDFQTLCTALILSLAILYAYMSHSELESANSRMGEEVLN